MIAEHGADYANMLARSYGKCGTDGISKALSIIKTVDSLSLPPKGSNHFNTIGKVDNINFIDESARAVASKLQNMIYTGEIVKTTGGTLRNESVVSVAVDSKTGEIYYGISNFNNNPTRDTDICEFLQDRLEEVPQLMPWSLDNCAEFCAVNNAINNGANVSDLKLYSVNIDTGTYKEPCDNCIAMYNEFLTFIEGE